MAKFARQMEAGYARCRSMVESSAGMVMGGGGGGVSLSYNGKPFEIKANLFER